MVNIVSRVRRTLVVGLFLPAAIAVLLTESACTANPPYRDLSPESIPAAANCRTPYARARWNDEQGRHGADAETDRVRLVIQKDLAEAQRRHESAPCWSSPLETHLPDENSEGYDLFSVEFDDQGWLAGTLSGQIPKVTQLDLLMERLNKLTQEGTSEGNHPLHLVIFVHGWHHSAEPDDRNVISFRRLLEHASIAEKQLCIHRRDRIDGVGVGGPDRCTDDEAVPAWKKKRRVVGIYLGWRGDSAEGFLLENTSIWDRKLAAETLSLGAIQEFFARIHSFYEEHDCHTQGTKYRNSRQLENCVDVRLLTAGHSFGGLITYRALAPRLMMGIAETGPDSKNQSGQYVVGFGDLTVLINPAFEATRFEPLAEAAVSRNYVGPGPDRNAQLPLLIVATSKTDRATEIAFPIFRRFSTLFDRAPGAESSANRRTIGWEPRYRTHEITVDMKSNVCATTSDMTFEARLRAEAKWSGDQESQSRYGSFDGQMLAMCDSLVLSRDNTWSVHRDGKPVPPQMPIWIVQADKSVINGHNDFLNDHFVDFIRQVYYTILRDQDEKMDALRNAVMH
jgi:hypothetical protein